jgi:hypothetical protein
MARADRSDMGPGAQGKKSGAGAMTEAPEDMIEENMLLSNRDKSRHSKERGLDSKAVESEQRQDLESGRRKTEEGDG